MESAARDCRRPKVARFRVILARTEARIACFGLLLGLLACSRSAPSAGNSVEEVESALTSGAVHVNCGGSATGSFVADTNFSGGATLTRNNAIDLSGVVNPAPIAVYQTQRYNNLTYTFGGFTVGSLNDVRLHFADTKWTTANQRLFNVTINGQLVLSNFDIIGTAGAANKAVAETFTLPASSSGNYVIQLVGTKDAAMICGVEITPTSVGVCDPSLLSSSGWVATASQTSGSNTPAHAIDGNTTTRWTSGVAQASGQYFQLDLQAPQTFSRIVMNAGSSGGDYAHKYSVFVSNDGTNFGTAVASGTGVKQIETVDFPIQTARYIRVVLAGSASNSWSIYEMNVDTSGCANSGASTGTLTLSGTLKDSAGTPIVGGRVNLSGAAQATRFSDFAGGYVFHVNPGTYTLTAAAECTLTPSSTTFTNMTVSKTQGFTATNGNCATVKAANTNPTGQQLTFTKGGAVLAMTYARVEARTNAADAQTRLQEIGAEQPGAASISVAGNAAIERQVTVNLAGPQADEEGTNDLGPSQFTAITTAVVVGSSVVRFESQVPLNAAADTLQRLLTAGRNFQPEDSAALHGSPPTTVGTSSFPPAARNAPSVATGTPFGLGTFGELQIAASDTTNAVVYGRQSGPFVSVDGGKTVQSSVYNTVAAPPLTFYSSKGDPSVVVGAPSGTSQQTFYFTQLQTATFGPPTLIAMVLYDSTDNGSTFNFVSFPMNCANAGSGCILPDQEQLTADRLNRANVGGSAGGGGTADQLYVGWRNFTIAGGRSPDVACSRDGGVTWQIDSTTLAAAGSDLPRLTVGPDGTLVGLFEIAKANGTYDLMLQRWASCANGFTPAKVVTVKSSVTEVTDMAGLDRNPVGNFSAAFDDTDPTGKRLFVVHANEMSTGNDDVIVQESFDGGSSFTETSAINTNHTGHRFFPHMCTTRGITHVTWYDRRDATTAAPDLTAYFRTTVKDDPTSLLFKIGSEINVSGVDDPECSTGFPGGARSSNEEVSCGADLPGGFIAGGSCQFGCPAGTPGLCGTQRPCDFRVPGSCPPLPAPDGGVDGGGDGGVPPPEACTPVTGVPKYGDYNGNACAGGTLYMAWASSTPPASPTCLVAGLTCTGASTCCPGSSCVGGTCAPVTFGTCTANGGACGSGLPICCSAGVNGGCEGGKCVPAVAIYTGSSGAAPPFLTAHGDLTQFNDDSVTICGTGVNFTPNGNVALSIEYFTNGGDHFRVLQTVVADATGSFTYSTGPNFYTDSETCGGLLNQVKFSAQDLASPVTPLPFSQVILTACQPNGATCP